MYNIITHGLAFITAVLVTIFITRKQSIYYVRKQIEWDIISIQNHLSYPNTPQPEDEELLVQLTQYQTAGKVIDKYIEELEEQQDA